MPIDTMSKSTLFLKIKDGETKMSLSTERSLINRWWTCVRAVD